VPLAAAGRCQPALGCAQRLGCCVRDAGTAAPRSRRAGVGRPSGITYSKVKPIQTFKVKQRPNPNKLQSNTWDRPRHKLPSPSLVCRAPSMGLRGALGSSQSQIIPKQEDFQSRHIMKDVLPAAYVPLICLARQHAPPNYDQGNPEVGRSWKRTVSFLFKFNTFALSYTTCSR